MKQEYTTTRDFYKAFKGILDEYAEDAKEDVEKVTLEVAKQCRKDVRQRAKSQQGRAQGGVSWSGYIKGWNYRKAKLPKYMSGASVYHVYNQSKPGLVHLLEFGHEVYNQYGKTRGTAGAYPHVMPAEAQAKRELMQKVKEVL